MTSVRIVETVEGTFLSYPNQKGKDGKYYQISFPANPEVKQAIESKVLEEYHKLFAVA